MSDYELINGDCLEVLPTLERESINLVVTSPSYDNLRNYNKELEWNFDIFKQIANELYGVIKDGGVVVWIVNDATINGSETGTSFRQALYFKKIGFNLHDTMIYHKKSLTFPEINRYYPCWEYMFILSKGKPKTTNLLKDRLNKRAGEKITSTTFRNKDGQLFEGTGSKNNRRFERWNDYSCKVKDNQEDTLLNWEDVVDLLNEQQATIDEQKIIIEERDAANERLNRFLIEIGLEKEYIKWEFKKRCVE